MPSFVLKLGVKAEVAAAAEAAAKRKRAEEEWQRNMAETLRFSRSRSTTYSAHGLLFKTCTEKCTWYGSMVTEDP